MRKSKMRVYEAFICDGSKILVRLPIRTRLSFKELKKRIRISFIRGKIIEGFETRDDLQDAV